MKEMSFKKIWWSSIITSIVFIIIGIVLFAYSEAIVETVSYIIGGVLLTIGTINLIRVFKNKETNLLNIELVYGILGLIFGLVLIFNPLLLTTIIQFFLGIWIIINGALKMQYTLELKKNNNEKWKLSLVLSLLILLIGILMIFNPFKTFLVVTKTIGIMVIIYSIIDIIESIILKTQVKTFEIGVEITENEEKGVEK